MSETALVHFSRARQALQKAKTIDEVKAVRDYAERLRLYLKQEKESLTMQNQAAAIRLRAERRAGEMIKEGQENGDLRAAGDNNIKLSNVGGNTMLPPTLEEAGITKIESSRWQTLTLIPEEKFDEFIDARINAEEELTQALALRYARREINLIERAEIGARPVVIPDGKYSCIVIDPPWPMEKIERDERPNQVGFEYPTMSEDELRLYPLPEFAADDCHLYLWTTHKFLPMALRLAEHWGFNYQCLMTWVKNVGFTPYSWMYSTEHVLFCRRGNLQLEKLGLRLDFQAKVREHSRKPEKFYELVRQASPGPRLDVFSREAREGFEQLGNEVEKFQEVGA